MYKITYQKEYVKKSELGTDLDSVKNGLRLRREQECFQVINRGILWYNQLSDEQYAELNDWYIKWLDVTETLHIPTEPTWLRNKLHGVELL